MFDPNTRKLVKRVTNQEDAKGHLTQVTTIFDEEGKPAVEQQKKKPKKAVAAPKV